jgi:hypothetical protein
MYQKDFYSTVLAVAIVVGILFFVTGLQIGRQIPSPLKRTEKDYPEGLLEHRTDI